jgi:Ca2+-binding EF-hand superfamily protein
MSAGVITNDYYKNPYPLAGDSDKANIHIDSLLKRLTNIANMRNIRVREFFQDYDKLRKKFITEAKFRSSLSSLNFQINESEFKALVNKYKKDNINNI